MSITCLSDTESSAEPKKAKISSTILSYNSEADDLADEEGSNEKAEEEEGSGKKAEEEEGSGKKEEGSSKKAGSNNVAVIASIFNKAKSKK